MNLETHVEPLEVMLRLSLAVLFGIALGLDRELKGHDAGLRTHMLVALGAAVTAIIAFELHEGLRKVHPETQADPLVVIEGVVAAVGFLGGGAILRGRGSVQGLTTAANIWVCGAVGLACGVGLYTIAAITLGFTVIVVTVVPWVERRIGTRTDEGQSRALIADSEGPQDDA